MLKAMQNTFLRAQGIFSVKSKEIPHRDGMVANEIGKQFGVIIRAKEDDLKWELEDLNDAVIHLDADYILHGVNGNTSENYERISQIEKQIPYVKDIRKTIEKTYSADELVTLANKHPYLLNDRLPKSQRKEINTLNDLYDQIKKFQSSSFKCAEDIDYREYKSKRPA